MRSVFQVLLVRVVQLIERGAEHVLDDDETRLRRDDETLGPDRAVAQVRRLLMQHRQRVHELTNEAERGVGLDRQQPRFGERENLGEPHTRRHGRRPRPAWCRVLPTRSTPRTRP